MLFLFSTVLSKIFYINDVYIYSTRQNNSWNYYNYPIQKFRNPWLLILFVVTWMIHDWCLFCDGCSWVPCLFWTVLQKNPPYPAESSVFQHLLHIWTISSSDCMILRSIFSYWGQLRGSNTTIKNMHWSSNIHWRSRRSLKRKLLNRMKIPFSPVLR